MKDKLWQRLPWQVLYTPMIPFIAYTFIRKGFRLSKVNPCMDNSGLFNSSKSKYLSTLPKEWVPDMEPFSYPMVVKPDNGERGKGVEIVHHDAALMNYLNNAKGLVLIQEYVDLPHEAGIFWADNKITSITLKKFKDGQPIGSHNLGTTFLDGRKFITKELNEAFRTIVDRMPGFTYGRFDVKYNSLSELAALTNFKILEVNGVAAEPTHVYEPGYSLRQAYKDMIHHWSLI